MNPHTFLGLSPIPREPLGLRLSIWIAIEISAHAHLSYARVDGDLKDLDFLIGLGAVAELVLPDVYRVSGLLRDYEDPDTILPWVIFFMTPQEKEKKNVEA